MPPKAAALPRKRHIEHPCRPGKDLYVFHLPADYPHADWAHQRHLTENGCEPTEIERDPPEAKQYYHYQAMKKAGQRVVKFTFQSADQAEKALAVFHNDGPWAGGSLSPYPDRLLPSEPLTDLISLIAAPTRRMDVLNAGQLYDAIRPWGPIDSIYTTHASTKESFEALEENPNMGKKRQRKLLCDWNVYLRFWDEKDSKQFEEDWKSQPAVRLARHDFQMEIRRPTPGPAETGPPSEEQWEEIVAAFRNDGFEFISYAQYMEGCREQENRLATLGYLLPEPTFSPPQHPSPLTSSTPSSGPAGDKSGHDQKDTAGGHNVPP